MYNNKYRHKIIFWKKVGGEKCNPKKIFYEFFKLFINKHKKFSSPSNFFLPNSKIFFAKNDTVSIKILHFSTDKKFFFRTPKMILHKIKSPDEK
jgi:hypothetical protein